MLPRFLNAITTMAISPEKSVRRRLAWVASDVLVFVDAEIPTDLKDRFELFKAIVNEPEVPKYAVDHPNYPSSVGTSYLSPSRAKQASELLVSMFEAIVFSASADQ